METSLETIFFRSMISMKYIGYIGGEERKEGGGGGLYLNAPRRFMAMGMKIG